MNLFDQKDRPAIEWGLKRVFDYKESKINRAIASQVLFNLMRCVLDSIFWLKNISVQVGQRLAACSGCTLA